MNDPPVWEQAPKGSEEDRIIIVYLPNKFIDKGKAPSSPRTFPKNLRIEEKIQGHDFALGHLLNLVQLRMKCDQAGGSLDEIIGAGTPTSRYWMRAWMEHWTGGRANQLAMKSAPDEAVVQAIANVRKVHSKYYLAGKKTLIEYLVREEKDLPVQGGRTKRWEQLKQLVANAGKLGAMLLTPGVTAKHSRCKAKEQDCLKVAPVDMERYDGIFSNTDVFGALENYSYTDKLDIATCPGHSDAVDDHHPMDLGETRRERARAREVFNLDAMVERQAQGAQVTDERRPDVLRKCIEYFRKHGKPVKINGATITECDSSPFWAALRSYYQSGDFGDIYEDGPGIMSLTRESRTTGHVDMCVGELDLVAAMYQMYLRIMGGLTSPDEYEQISDQVQRFVNNSDVWKIALAEYYEVDEDVVGKIFKRVYAEGRASLDGDVECTRSGDMLPCVLELRHQIRMGHAMMAQRCDIYKSISRLPKIQQRERPAISCFTIRLQTELYRVNQRIAALTRMEPLHILGYVHDSVYALAADRPQLVKSFHQVAAGLYRDTSCLMSLKSSDGAKLAKFTPPVAADPNAVAATGSIHVPSGGASIVCTSPPRGCPNRSFLASRSSLTVCGTVSFVSSLLELFGQISGIFAFT